MSDRKDMARMILTKLSFDFHVSEVAHGKKLKKLCEVIARIASTKLSADFCGSEVVHGKGNDLS